MPKTACLLLPPSTNVRCDGTNSTSYLIEAPLGLYRDMTSQLTWNLWCPEATKLPWLLRRAYNSQSCNRIHDRVFGDGLSYNCGLATKIITLNKQSEV